MEGPVFPWCILQGPLSTIFASGTCWQVHWKWPAELEECQQFTRPLAVTAVSLTSNQSDMVE